MQASLNNHTSVKNRSVSYYIIKLMLISSIPYKNSALCLKTSYFMNKKEPPPPPGGKFASGAVWHTIAFKVSAFHFLWPKTY